MVKFGMPKFKEDQIEERVWNNSTNASKLFVEHTPSHTSQWFWKQLVDDAFPPDDIGSGLYTQFIICIPCIIVAF